MTDCASGHVDPDECFQHEEDHDNEDDLEPENDSEPIQVIQPQAEGPRDPLGEVELDEPIASRTRSQTDPLAARPDSHVDQIL